jgi:hypothetical protein
MDAIPYPIGRYFGKRCLAGMRITMDSHQPYSHNAGVCEVFHRTDKR